MAAQIVKPLYTPTQSAWIAAYVASHGPIKVLYDGHPSAIASNGWITVGDKPVEVIGSMLVQIDTNAQAAVKASTPAMIDAWIAAGLT